MKYEIHFTKEVKKASEQQWFYWEGGGVLDIVWGERGDGGGGLIYTVMIKLMMD